MSKNSQVFMECYFASNSLLMTLMSLPRPPKDVSIQRNRHCLTALLQRNRCGPEFSLLVELLSIYIWSPRDKCVAL